MPQPAPKNEELQKALQAAMAQNAVLLQENKLLREKVELLVKKIFGIKSEKLDPEQLQLLIAGLEQPPKKEPAPGVNCGALEAELDKPQTPRKTPPRAERQARVPQHLPAVEEIIDPEEVKAAPGQWRQIGQEVTEQLDYEPGRFLRRRLIRRKYVKLADKHAPPVIAKLSTLQERSIAAPGLLAQIVVSKYCDHLPLYRQEQMMMTRYGIEIPRQTMARWMGMVADWLQPIYQQIRITIFESGCVQIDETPVEYLCPGHGQTKLGYLWTCKDPRGDAFYSWQLGRSAACLENIVPLNFKGILQCDGYSAYNSFAREHAPRIKLAGCMAHARRQFFEAKENAGTQAYWILLQIQHLYRIEQRMREQRAGPRLRQALRSSQSKPVMERIHQALNKLKAAGSHLPESTMGKAIDYALDQWPKLCQYLQDGRLEIDNNLVENAIRPTALGKKNWLFIGEADAGERSAILYTVIESCRRRGLDPYSYLRDVLSRLPSMTTGQLHQVMPEAWGQTHATGRRKAA